MDKKADLTRMEIVVKAEMVRRDALCETFDVKSKKDNEALVKLWNKAKPQDPIILETIMEQRLASQDRFRAFLLVQRARCNNVKWMLERLRADQYTNYREKEEDVEWFAAACKEYMPV